MSMIWRSAMPLLTTLAALVIIVHCVEEEMETEYRHDLRPRILDTETANDEAWRVIEEAPMVHHSRHTGDDNARGDGPRRRTPDRKRKRRLNTPDVDHELRDRFAYPDEPPRPYYDVDYEHNRPITEKPKRRRKKPVQRPSRWADDDVMVVERPIRRRNAQRKRPSLETWPVLSEFGNLAHLQEDKEKNNIDIIDILHSQEVAVENIGEQMTNTKLEEKVPPEESTNVRGDELNTNPADDKSLSEFSLELVSNIGATKPNLVAKDTYDTGLTENQEPVMEYDKEQANYPMDPITLKEILKKSNGTSLSEILQQHNLSLSDLLSGKEHAVSILKSQDSLEDQHEHGEQNVRPMTETEQTIIKSDDKFDTQPVTEYFNTTQEVVIIKKTESEPQPTTTTKPVEENLPTISTRRRFPTVRRKKLRMRPVLNVTNTHKGQLSRDLIALNARRYSNQRRYMSKSKEWRDVIPSMRNNTQKEKTTTPIYETTTVTIVLEETTIPIEIINNDTWFEGHESMSHLDTGLDHIDMDTIEPVAATESTAVTIVSTEVVKTINDLPAGIHHVRPSGISTGLRQHAFNNRLKRKRLKHKNLTTEPPPDDEMKGLLEMGNLVSSSEFIAKTEAPRTTRGDDKELTTLNDEVTTRKPNKNDAPMQVKLSTTHTTPKPIIQSTTEEIAKMEIQEILKDTTASAKLSKILKERNMTLNELVEHRERGSSHIHLADIFHNASREPNPPEPFLSKSLIEPISKETYPLRAILEANLHEANGKVPTIDPEHDINDNIPVIMDHRNNINENAENMGIMALFKNFTTSSTRRALPSALEEEEKAKGLHIAPNVTEAHNSNRASRVLPPNDIVSWNEIFSLMGRTNNETDDLTSGQQPYKMVNLDEAADDEGLILLEDLQHLVDFENNAELPESESTDTIDIRTLEQDDLINNSILDKIPSQTKSVTIATASIAGLAMILFLITYVIFKWKRQNSLMNKRNFSDQRIPTPVFENRKGHKNNSSSRSISPMLQNSNIYMLDTIGSQNSKDSPDYMWDSLRKPFQ